MAGEHGGEGAGAGGGGGAGGAGGEEAEGMRRRAREYRKKAKAAVEEGGSSPRGRHLLRASPALLRVSGSAFHHLPLGHCIR